MTENTHLAMLARSRRRKAHAHWWIDGAQPDPVLPCAVPGCGITREEYEARQRRGRNNRSRGGRAELDVARTYGGQKVGPLGLPEDIRGKQWRTQVKVVQRSAPAVWLEEFRKLDGLRDGRTSRLILRFTRQGVKSEDFVVVRGLDWLAWFGRDE